MPVLQGPKDLAYYVTGVSFLFAHQKTAVSNTESNNVRGPIK